MNTEEFTELLAAAKRLADAGAQIVHALALHTREIADPVEHAALTKLLNTVRDVSMTIRHALADAPRK